MICDRCGWEHNVPPESDVEIEKKIILAYERGRQDGKSDRSGHPGMVVKDLMFRTKEMQVAQTWQCERTLKLVGPKAWIEMTLSKSIAGELNCVVGKILERRGEILPWGGPGGS